MIFWYFQVESDGSRSGSSLSLRNMSGATNNAAGGGPHTTGGTGSGGAGGASQSPSHGNSSNSGSGSTSHNRVQRSISATSSKPRRGSTGAQDPNSTGGDSQAFGSLTLDFELSHSFFPLQVPRPARLLEWIIMFSRTSSDKIRSIQPLSRKIRLDTAARDPQQQQPLPPRHRHLSKVLKIEKAKIDVAIDNLLNF